MSYEFNAWPRVNGELLDTYLALGWYRMGPFVFTTRTVSLDNVNEYPVYWLRYNVESVKLNKKNIKLDQTNAHFSVFYRPLELTDELEALFLLYRSSLKFDIGQSLNEILGSTATFDSIVVEVRDSGKLIAAGVIDAGDSSIEGIINIYDPAYSRYSLGKYLILKEYQFCMQHGFAWFYPGYYMPGHQVFSYKLFLDKGATEVYLPDEECWISYHEFASRPAVGR